jgi:catechol 2,3-dioxygenase-like lactoylglutathione lyase family enzyme
MTTLDKRIDVIDLYVGDVAGTRTFYERVFGLPATRRPDCVDFAFGDTICHLRDASTAEEFIAPAKVAGSEDGSCGAFVIFVDRLDDACAELTGLGVKLINGPAVRATGMRTACFADPAGQIWALAADPRRAGQPEGGAEAGAWSVTRNAGAWSVTPKRIGLVALFVADMERATSFYHCLLGSPAEHRTSDFADFRLDGITLGLLAIPAARDLIEPARIADSSSCLRFTFCTFVDDAAAVCCELGDHGVSPFKGPTDFSLGHRVVSLRAPGGHVWEVVSAIPDRGA